MINNFFSFKAKREQELAEKAAAAAEAQQNAENQEGGNVSADGTPLDIAHNNQTPDSTLPAQNSEESKLSETLNETTTESKEKFSDLSSLIDDKFVHLSESGAIIVHDDHPDIEVAVQRALEEAEKSPITLPVDIYIDALKKELERIQKERQKLDATALSEGGWILDNFPNTTDQLNAMTEHHLLPDSIITLDDVSDSFNVLMRRWYSANRNEIDQRIQARLAQEELKRLEDQQK